MGSEKSGKERSARGSGGRRARDQANFTAGAGAGGELHLGDGHCVRGVRDCCGRGRLGDGALSWSGRGDASLRGCGCDGGNAAWGRDGWDQRDCCRDSGYDAWVLGHVGAADSCEVGKSGLDFFVGCPPCLDAGDYLVGELGVRAEAARVAVGLALWHQGEPGVDALGD